MVKVWWNWKAKLDITSEIVTNLFLIHSAWVSGPESQKKGISNSDSYVFPLIFISNVQEWFDEGFTPEFLQLTFLEFIYETQA